MYLATFEARKLLQQWTLGHRNDQFYLATKGGIVLLQGMIPNTDMVIRSNTVSIQLMNSPGAQISQVRNVICQQNDNHTTLYRHLGNQVVTVLMYARCTGV